MRSVVTISLPEKLAKQLARAAKQLGIPKSQYVRKALERSLRLQEFERLRKEIQPAARKAGLLTDEDVFERFS